MNRTGPNYTKLKTSLELAISRLKVLQIKKSKENEKLKSEIFNYVKNGRHILANFRVQKLIKGDASIEAMKLIEIHCEEILVNYELFQQNRQPDTTIITQISSLIWVAPYYQNHIRELKVILFQLAYKYGVNFCIKVLRNEIKTVDLELIHRVKMFHVSNEKIEHYLQNTVNCRSSCKKTFTGKAQIDQTLKKRLLLNYPTKNILALQM